MAKCKALTGSAVKGLIATEAETTLHQELMTSQLQLGSLNSVQVFHAERVTSYRRFDNKLADGCSPLTVYRLYTASHCRCCYRLLCLHPAVIVIWCKLQRRRHGWAWGLNSPKMWLSALRETYWSAVKNQEEMCEIVKFFPA